MHRHLDAGVYHMKNNNQFIAGIPDVWYSGRARDIWVEYKFIVVPKRDSTIITPDLSQLQKKWLRDRRSEGRDVAVAVGCKDGAVFFNEPVLWEGGLTTAAFRAAMISRRSLAQHLSDFVNLA